MKKSKQVTESIDKDFYKKHRCKSYASSCTVYQSADGETHDVNEAVKDALGRPVVFRRDAKITKPANYFPKQRLTFNPKNPSARMLAFEARAMVESSLPPTIYDEKFDAVRKADNAAHAFENKYNNFINNSKSAENGNP